MITWLSHLSSCSICMTLSYVIVTNKYLIYLGKLQAGLESGTCVWHTSGIQCPKDLIFKWCSITFEWMIECVNLAWYLSNTTQLLTPCRTKYHTLLSMAIVKLFGCFLVCHLSNFVQRIIHFHGQSKSLS